MPKFLIEIPHEATTAACARVVEHFLRSGSHFLTHADWGCKDGDHRAFVTIEVDTRDEARSVIPPTLRVHAKIVQLNSFTMKDIEHLLSDHQA